MSSPEKSWVSSRSRILLDGTHSKAPRRDDPHGVRVDSCSRRCHPWQLNRHLVLRYHGRVSRDETTHLSHDHDKGSLLEQGRLAATVGTHDYL